MSFADLQPALSTGAVDGQENPINLFLAFRMDTLAQKHLTVWNYVNDPLIFALSKRSGTASPRPTSSWCATAPRKPGSSQIALTRNGLGLDGGDDRSLRRAAHARGRGDGAQPRPRSAAFATATRPVYDKWSKTSAPSWSARPKPRSARDRADLAMVAGWIREVPTPAYG